ncbi:MAG: MBL fold metallo-hydrolase [Tumebacillaceae bacterium]
MIASAKGVHAISVPTPIEVGPVNVYLLRDEHCLTLVDTGPLADVSEAGLRSGLRELGLVPADLDQIVLTHYHCDHTGLLEKLVQESGAKVYAHEQTARLLRPEGHLSAERLAFFRDLFAKMGMTRAHTDSAVQQILRYGTYMCQGSVDVMLAEGDSIPGLDGWRVIYTPGHSQEHISLLREEDGTMILGDHLIQHISSNALIEPPDQPGEERPKSLIVYREALKKVMDLEWKIGYPGHGVPITEYRALIQERLHSNELRAQALLEHIKQGKRTAAEITFALFTRHFEQLTLIASETLGHLDWMVEEGVLAVEENEQGVWEYSLG